MLEGKRVLVFIYSIEYLRELLCACNKRGLNEQKIIVLTSNPSIPRNFAQLMKDHHKKIEMDKLSKHYKSLKGEMLRATTDNNFNRRDELEQESTNRKKQIKQLHDQIKREIFADADVIFNPRENIEYDSLLIFRTDVQMIVNTKFYNKVNILKTLAQVTI